jgi:RNA polymerase sigma factor (sigma-70 family)
VTVRPLVRTFCRRAFSDHADAEDLFQRIAIRAWRGHATFRGDCAYPTWVMRIAEREVARMAAERTRSRSWATSLEEARDPADRADQIDQPGAVPVPDAEPGGGWLPRAIARARTEAALTEIECEVLLARLRHPDDTWQATGQRLDMSATACAVAHCRAVPRLRVFLFLHAPETLGGPSAIASAYARAVAAVRDPLTGAEAEAFRYLVVERRTDFRRRGWRTALRAACAKVVAHLDER